MAKSLDELLKLKGVIAVGEFSSDGRLVDYRGKQDMPQDVLSITAQFAAAVTQLLSALAAAHTKISGLNWLPEKGWAYSGGDMTIAVYEHPLVPPQFSHLRHVPLRTSLNCLHSMHGSPSYPCNRAV
jgi:roadblock/LC7 domain-containing protein